MKPLKFLFSLIISALFLYLALRGLDLAAIGQSLQGVQLPLLFLAMVIHLSSFWIRSIRWTVLLTHIKPLSPSIVFSPLAISYLANNTLPMRAGEVVRAYLLGRDQGISKASGLSSIVLERICDGLTVLSFLGGVALLAPLPAWARSIGLLAGAGFVGATTFLLGLAFFRRQTFHLVRKISRFLPQRIGTKLDSLLERFVEGLDVLQDPRALFAVFGWSVVVWGVEAVALHLTAIACHLSLPLTGSVFALVITNLGIMVPSSPGYVGTFEFFCRKSLDAFGVAAVPALGFALVLHVVQFVPITLVGLACLLKQRVSLRSVAIQEGVTG